jgi:hypothetical protein
MDPVEILTGFGKSKPYSNDGQAYLAAAHYIKTNHFNKYDSIEKYAKMNDLFAQEKYKEYCESWNDFVKNHISNTSYIVRVETCYLNEKL